MPMITPRELFGGAITMDLPSELIDASDLRQVPDTQEVFLSPDSDVSFVLEILQRVDESDDESAAKFHFVSLAHDNSATSEKITDITLPSELQSPSPPATPYPTILSGEQEVKKFNGATADQVRILMSLYRIEAKGVDLVLTVNVPQPLEQGPQADEEGWQKAKQIFAAATGSLKILDFSLFA